MQNHIITGNAIKSYSISRIFRIVPLFYVIMALTYVLHVGLFGVWHSLSTVLLSASFLFNLVPGAQEGYVWASWTIGVEMLFYFIFPALYSHQNSWPRRISLILFSVILWIIFQGVSSIIVPEATRESFENFSVFRYFPIFLIGMMAHALYSSPTVFKQLQAFSMAALSAGGLGLLGIATGKITGGPLDKAHIIGVCYASILLGIAGPKFFIVENILMQFLGKISYSMYLIHAPVIWVLSPVYGVIIEIPAQKSIQFLMCFIITISVVVPMSWLSYRLLERPFIALGRRLSQMPRNMSTPA